MEPGPLALGVWSLNSWTTREVPGARVFGLLGVATGLQKVLNKYVELVNEDAFILQKDTVKNKG